MSMSFRFSGWGDWSKLSPTNLMNMKADICDSGSSYALTEKCGYDLDSSSGVPNYGFTI